MREHAVRSPERNPKPIKPFKVGRNKNHYSRNQKKMNHIKFCGCHACKAGKHAPVAKKITRSKIRANRHSVKVALAVGAEPTKCISAGRTD